MSSKSKRNHGKRGAPARRDQNYRRWAPLLAHLEPAPVAPNATCSDCGAVFDHVAQQMTHEDGCPIHADYEAASDDDAEWFREHPGVTERRRTPTMGEVQQQMLMTRLELPDFNTDVSYEPAGQVVVSFIAEGVRLRNFSESMLIANLGRTGSDAK